MLIEASLHSASFMLITHSDGDRMTQVQFTTYPCEFCIFMLFPTGSAVTIVSQ